MKKSEKFATIKTQIIFSFPNYNINDIVGLNIDDHCMKDAESFAKTIGFIAQQYYHKKGLCNLFKKEKDI